MRKENAYILRLWCDAESDLHWRASLEDLRTRQVTSFGDLNKLAMFLQGHPEKKPDISANALQTPDV